MVRPSHREQNPGLSALSCEGRFTPLGLIYLPTNVLLSNIPCAINLQFGGDSMAFERVAHFARLAASDGEVLAALQDNPESMRQPLELSDGQVRALISASAFTSANPVHTSSRAEDPVGDTNNLMELGTLGTLLPPEGSGSFPAPGDLPPAPVSPIAAAPTPSAPSPKAVPGVAPHGTSPFASAPQSAAPNHSASPAHTPQAASPVSAPQASPTASTPSSAAPASSAPAFAAPGRGAGPSAGSSQPIATAPSGASGTIGQVVQSCGTTPIQATSGVCGCSCDVGILAIVAEVSATAQAAITAITALAGMN